MTTYGYSHQYNDGFHPQNGYTSSHVRQHSYYANPAYNNYASTTSCGATANHAVYDQPSYGPGNGYYAPTAPVAQPAAEERTTGGVSSVLDYDLATMSKFTTYLAFRLFQRADTGNTHFAAKVQNILSAVRLPLSSLILANYYLLSKYEKRTDLFLENSSDEIVQQNVILSLLLANKANDDNTFTNKSWSDATGLHVRLINSLEVDWLVLFDWKLHDTNFPKYFELKTQYEKYADALKAQQLQEQQQFQTQQYQQSMNFHYREPISPILNNNEFSPIQDSSSRFSNQYQPWTRPTSYGFQSSGFDQPQPSSHHPSHRSQPSQSGYYYGSQAQQLPIHNQTSHRKNYSLQFEPDYCARTGAHSRSSYCDCRYCFSPTRAVDWSYNNMLASAY